MTNTTQPAPALSCFVVVRPIGARDCRDASAFECPQGTDPVKVARASVLALALADDEDQLEWRVVASADAGAARLEWPAAACGRRGCAHGGTFTV
jgi:hypothetical protein